MWYSQQTEDPVAVIAPRRWWCWWPPRRRGWLESGWLSTSVSPSSWSSLSSRHTISRHYTAWLQLQHTAHCTLNCDSQQTDGVCSVCPAALLPRPTQVPPAGCGEGGARAPHRDTARPLSGVTRSLALTVASIAVFIIPLYQREVCWGKQGAEASVWMLVQAEYLAE